MFIEALTPADLEFIACSSFPDLPASLLSRMVAFTGRVARETGELRAWGSQGGPWEMNLRDLARWASATKLSEHCRLGPAAAANLVYLQRMRTAQDRLKVSSRAMLSHKLCTRLLYQNNSNNYLKITRMLLLFYNI